MFGQGSSLLGDGSAISEALQRRSSGAGAPVSPLSQVSSAAPSFQGATPPQPGNTSAMPRQQSMTSGTGMPPDSSEAQIIVKALRDRLGNLSKTGI